MNLSTATKYANAIVERLAPHCERIEIAGSIRRLKPEVGDIEIVCQPKKIFNQTDLFGGGVLVIDHGFENAIPDIMHELIKGHLDGRYMQMYIKQNHSIKLDLFMPEPDDYYRQLAIRTGSSDYNKYVIAPAWKALGWVGAGEDGLRRKEDCIEVPSGDKTKWKLFNPDGAKAPVWQSEQEFFHWLQILWAKPQYREYKNTLNHFQ